MESTEKAQNFPYISASSNTGAWKSEIYVLFMKRVFDLCLCFVLLPLILPILVILVVFIKGIQKAPLFTEASVLVRTAKDFIA